MNLEYRIDESYDRPTANDREVLNRISRNKTRSAGMNSTELATFCHVSRITLIRLLKKLGIDGFAGFKFLLKKRAGMQGLARLDMEEIISNYHRIVNDPREHNHSVILEAIYEAGTIYLYSIGNEQKITEEEFKRIFLMFRKCCTDLFDYGEVGCASRYFGPGDLFMAISSSGESESGVRVLRFVQYREIKTLSITRQANDTMARIYRYNLYAGTRMISGDEEPGYEIVTTFHILLDMLSINYLGHEGEGHEAGRSVRQKL